MECPSFELTKSTLDHTTHVVTTLQTESRKYMHDNYKTRSWALRPKRIDDVMYSDTFFASVYSIRCYKCIQIFAYKHSRFGKISPMRREADTTKVIEMLLAL